MNNKGKQPGNNVNSIVDNRLKSISKEEHNMGHQNSHHEKKDDYDDEDFHPEHEEPDLPPIIDGEFDDMDDEDVEKEFKPSRHYEEEIDDDDED